MTDESRRSDGLGAFEDGYQAPLSVSGGKKKVRIVGTEREFASFAACGEYLRISPKTVSEMARSEKWPGDVQIELI